MACKRKLPSRIAKQGYLKPSQKKSSWGWSNNVGIVQFIPDASADRQNSTLSHPSGGAASFKFFFLQALQLCPNYGCEVIIQANQSGASIFHYCKRLSSQLKDLRKFQMRSYVSWLDNEWAVPRGTHQKCGKCAHVFKHQRKQSITVKYMLERGDSTI